MSEAGAPGLDPSPTIVVEVFGRTCARPVQSEPAFKEDVDKRRQSEGQHAASEVYGRAL